MTQGCIKYSAGYRYQLSDAACFETGIKGYVAVTKWVSLLDDGRLVLHEGYATDGITGITGTAWAWLLEKGWLLYSSFEHDGLYQLMRLGLLPANLRPRVDDLLAKRCVEAGAYGWQAALVHKAVVKFGESSATSPDRPVLKVP